MTAKSQRKKGRRKTPSGRTRKIPSKYAPRSLSKADRRKARRSITASRKAYQYGVYMDRPKLSSYEKRKSRHVQTFRRRYGVPAAATRDVAKKTGCRLETLKLIVSRGKGAYYSSGSRPNQTPSSWGRARLASALTGGPASKSDRDLLQNDPGCIVNGSQ